MKEIISDRLGRTRAKEQYAFLYRCDFLGGGGGEGFMCL